MPKRKLRLPGLLIITVVVLWLVYSWYNSTVLENRATRCMPLKQLVHDIQQSETKVFKDCIVGAQWMVDGIIVSDYYCNGIIDEMKSLHRYKNLLQKLDGYCFDKLYDNATSGSVVTRYILANEPQKKEVLWKEMMKNALNDSMSLAHLSAFDNFCSELRNRVPR